MAGNDNFRSLVLGEIRELLGGDGDDFGRKSQELMDALYKEGKILYSAKSEGLFEGFNWIDPLIPLEAEDLGWGYKPNREDASSELSLSSGGKSNRVVITREGYNQRLDQTNSFADPYRGIKESRELYDRYRFRVGKLADPNDPYSNSEAWAKAYEEVFGLGVRDIDAVRKIQKDREKRFNEDKEYMEEIKQEHIKKFGYSYTRIDKDGYDKNPKAVIEIFDDELAYNSLGELALTIGKGKGGQTKTTNLIRKIQIQLEESAIERGVQFNLEDGPDGWKFYLKKLDMSYIEEENNERLRLIEKYKSEGLTAVEASIRAYEDMKNDERFSYGKRFLKTTEDENEQ